MKRLVLVFVLIASSCLTSIQPASAETRVFSKRTTVDIYNTKVSNPAFDIQQVSVALFDTDLDMIHFWILFAQPLTADMFNDNKGSWAGILIDTNNDGKDDIVLNTLAKTYSGATGQSASGSYRVGSKSCPTVSWMDLDNKGRWLGFKVSQKCLGLSNKFEVQGYADYVASDSLSYDYAPDDYESIDLGDYYNPKPKVTMVIPSSTENLGKSQDNYALPPVNLVNLSAGLRDSVVTIECINGDLGGTGTAWSANVSIPIELYKSYLITNYHVISDCIIRGTVSVILNNNSRYTGLLAAWDPDNDVAGIYLTAYVPPLLWQGEYPLQGAWVGVIGSPKGLPGILTTGIVSSVSIAESYVTFTAPINPGNSGGPVFDSTGRVIAIATAKVRDSEGFGIGNGVPLICKVVVNCSVNYSGWISKSSAAAIQAVADLKATQESAAKASQEAEAKAVEAFETAEAAGAIAQDVLDAANATTDAAISAANAADEVAGLYEQSLSNSGSWKEVLFSLIDQLTIENADLAKKINEQTELISIAQKETEALAAKIASGTLQIDDFTKVLTDSKVKLTTLKADTKNASAYEIAISKLTTAISGLSDSISSIKYSNSSQKLNLLSINSSISRYNSSILLLKSITSKNISSIEKAKKIISDEAAAELKTKQEADAKVAADKAAAEAKIAADKAAAEAKIAADKAAAEAKIAADKAAAAKKTTITCIKGKLIKKVTAVKPACPKGYKKK
jgi:hypothetical protein